MSLHRWNPDAATAGPSSSPGGGAALHRVNQDMATPPTLASWVKQLEEELVLDRGSTRAAPEVDVQWVGPHPPSHQAPPSIYLPTLEVVRCHQGQ